MQLDKPIVLNLGKLLIAIAWSDGDIDDEELQIVKDIVFRIPEMTDDDWASIEVYMSPPMTRDETMLCIKRMKELVTTSDEQKYIIKAMREVVCADGEITREEVELFNLMVGEIQDASIGYQAKLERLFESAKKRRQRVFGKPPKRERNWDDFVDQPIFYRVLQSITAKGIPLHMDKAELEKLCTAGALMAAVVQADGVIDLDEVDAVRRALIQHFEISNEGAEVVAGIAITHEISGMDILRLCRKYFAVTKARERLAFVNALVAIMQADRSINAEEQEKMRAIATHLKIPYGIIIEIMPSSGSL